MTPSHVLLFAFACEPQRGSEPGAGYYFARAAAQYSVQYDVPVTIVTRPHVADKLRAAIENEVPGSRVDVFTVSIPMWLVSITRRERVRLAYLVWQLKAVAAVKRVFGGESQVVAHHVTFATSALPTFEWRLPKHWRRVFGPMGSAQEINRQLNSSSRLTFSIREGVRSFFTRLNLQDADLIVCQNSWTAEDLPNDFSGEVTVEPNIVVSRSTVAQATVGVPRDKNRLAIVGGLTERKQPHIAVLAMSFLPEEYSLSIIGSGPLEASLRKQVSDLGVEARVTFLGELSRAEVLAELASSSVLLHPSRQEGAPWVVGEAQALGVAPVVFVGSGADSIVEIGAQGRAVPFTPSDASANAKNLARGVLEVSSAPFKSVERWDARRLPEILHQWYEPTSTPA